MSDPADHDDPQAADTDRRFRAMADAFIDLANRHGESAPREHVGLALLYAAARFNAYVVATHAPDRAKYEADRETAIAFFTAEYLRMLNENLDDYRGVYGETLKYAHLMKPAPDAAD